MKQALKNWLLPIKNCLGRIKIQGALSCLLYFIIQPAQAQLANYVNNGGFEVCENCSTWNGIGPLLAKYWNSIDTTQTKASYARLSELPPSPQVPQSGYSWQWPRTGRSYIIVTLYLFPNSTQSQRLYARNELKQNLQAGKTYCVKFYWNITNQSSCGTDGMGAYFGDNSLDTITQSDRPITFLTPQVQNPTGNMLKDTLNWILFTGTFTANGTEKYMMLGNYKTDVATNSVVINPANMPTKFTDILYDDVSCLDVDLPAFAGYDYYMVPGDSAFIGRTPDVGINEACTWYQLPNMATPIATIAGMYVKPANTTTYVVRQEICGGIKWDTVVVYKSAVGIPEAGNRSQDLREPRLYPVPANETLNVQWESEVFEKEFIKAEVLNSLGLVCLQPELSYENKQAAIPIKVLPPGFYTLRLKGVSSPELSRRFVIAR
jgi:hypothetical protein